MDAENSGKITCKVSIVGIKEATKKANTLEATLKKAKSLADDLAEMLGSLEIEIE